MSAENPTKRNMPIHSGKSKFSHNSISPTIGQTLFPGLDMNFLSIITKATSLATIPTYIPSLF